MAKEKAPAKVFTWKDIKVIYKTASERGDGGTILRVGAWIVDGRETRAIIEKRDYWNEEDGGFKIGKAKGLNGSDLLKLLEHKNILFPALGIPTKEADKIWIQDNQPNLSISKKQDDPVAPF